MLKHVLKYAPKELCKGPFKTYETPMEEDWVLSFFATLMLSYIIFPKILVTQKAEIQEDVYMPYFHIYQASASGL